MVDENTEKGEKAFKRINEGLNQQDQDRVIDIARFMRLQVIDRIFNAFKEHLEHINDSEQPEQTELSQLTKLQQSVDRHPSSSVRQPHEIFVITKDILAAPFIHGQPQVCLAIHMERKKKEGQKSNDSLTLYLPQPNFTPGYSDVDDLEEPEEIYIERVDADGNITRSAVGREGAYSYVGVGDQKGGVQDNEGFTDEGVEELLTKRVDTKLPELTKLLEDLLNMDTVRLFKST